MRAKDLGKIHNCATYWLVPEKSNTTSISTSFPFVKQDNAATVLPASQGTGRCTGKKGSLRQMWPICLWISAVSPINSDFWASHLIAVNTVFPL